MGVVFTREKGNITIQLGRTSQRLASALWSGGRLMWRTEAEGGQQKLLLFIYVLLLLDPSAPRQEVAWILQVEEPK